MINSNKQKPIVLVLAGHDPSGGAGIQADIESIANASCHTVSVITSLTTQNTHEVTEVIPQEKSSFKKQMQLILEDMDINACKIGMFGDSELIEVAHDLLSDINIPVVLDPIISSGSGTIFSNTDVCEKIISLLLPLSTIVTPNSIEARTLSGLENLHEAAEQLIKLGTENVLITGSHENTESVTNSLYSSNNKPYEYNWTRLTDTYHGSGCTLSSRIAAQLALGNDIKAAVEESQEYTWNTLSHGLKLGHGQKHPNRFFNHDKTNL